ncbi:hypothetical protein COO60DRAFT_126133 [Scenedesmus sp. NREL 46B-D3]|nr:hypothetical protein COO60DRAFT_126133 [Scenedesmus sp. NREL 46B-D3]
MGAHSACRAHGAVLLLVLYYQGAVTALHCTHLSGCTACTQQQPQPRIPKLPAGYRINPLLLAPGPPVAASKTAFQSTNTANSSSTSTSAGSSSNSSSSNGSTYSSVASSRLGAALAALAGKARSLLQTSSIASEYFGMATPADTNIQEYVSSVQAPQQLIPQLQLASTPSSTLSGASLLGVSQPSFNSSWQQITHAAGMPVAQIWQQQQQQQSTGMPLISAPLPPAAAAAAAAGAAGNPMQVPPAFSNVPKESLNILVTDPRNMTGPHPWDVLLFKTNQFNTSQPAYRLGGVGLMLMTDFNKSQPLTDWHILRKEEPKQRAQVFEKWSFGRDFGSSGDKQASSPSSSSSSSSSSNGASAPPAAGSTAPLFGFKVSLAKNPLASFGSSGKETKPRFSSLFKLPQMLQMAGASLDAVGVASVPATPAGGQAAGNGSVRLWCTACQAPAYFLSAYGYCACSPGYGRVIDSKTPYACIKCPASQVSVVASLGGQQQQQQQQQQQSGKPTEIRLAGPDDSAAAAAAAAADKPVLAVCQACPEGTVPNEIQTACVAL